MANETQTAVLNFWKWFCCHHLETGLKGDIIGL